MLDSSLEFKKLIRENSSCELSGKIVFADGTERQLTGDDFMSESGSFDSCTSTSGSFDIGNASIGTFECSLNNADGRFSTFDFDGATIYPVVMKKLSNSYELIPKGIFNMEAANSLQSVVSITAYDNMIKFEKPYSEVSTAYPANLYKIVNDICTHCGVTLSTTRFDNYEYTIDKRPEDDMSCIDVISYVAQISGHYAKVDTNGYLGFKWYVTDLDASEKNYEGGTFDTKTTPYSDGDTLDGGNFMNYGSGAQADGGGFTDSDGYRIQAFTKPYIWMDEIGITGINIKVSDDEGNEQNVLVGTNTYALSISGNPFINTGNVNDIAQMIAKNTIGLKFRPFSVSAMPDPTLEAGDPVLVVTQNGFYKSFVTRNTYKMGKYQSIACEAETPSKNRASTRGATTTVLQQAKAIVNKKVSAYDLQIQALTNLMSNSFGVFKSEEKLADGSTIYYLHNKPERSQSSTIWKMTANTLTVSTDGGRTWNAGIDAYGNAAVNVLSAVGVNADWINAGTITGRRIDNGNGTFVVDEDGNLVATSAEILGSITSINNNEKSIVSSGKLYFYRDGKLLSTFSPAHWEDTNIQGTAIHSETDSKFIDFGNYDVNQDKYATHMIMNYGLNPDGHAEGVLIYVDTYISGKLKVKNGYGEEGFTLLDKSGHEVSTEWDGLNLNFYVDGVLKKSI